LGTDRGTGKNSDPSGRKKVFQKGGPQKVVRRSIREGERRRMENTKGISLGTKQNNKRLLEIRKGSGGGGGGVGLLREERSLCTASVG